MVRAREAQPIPIGIPSRGISSRYGPGELPPEFALDIRDMEYDRGVLGTPFGSADAFDPVSTYVSAMAPHPTDADLIVHVDTTDAASGTLRYNTWDPFNESAGTAGTVSIGSAAAEPDARALNFAKRNFFFLFGNEPVVFDGSSWATVSFTGPTLANVVGGFSHREHMYVFEHLSQSVWFGSVGGIAGAFTEFDLSSITEEHGNIMCGFSFTLSGFDQTQALWCVVTDAGEVIAYDGANPSNGFVLVGKPQIAPPVGYQSIIKVNGDVLVITRAGIVSMRQLFTTAGGDATIASITYEIEQLWGFIIDSLDAYDAATSFDPRASSIGRIKGAFHPQKNKLVIHIPGSVGVTPGQGIPWSWTDPDEGGGTSQGWVYDYTQKAWTQRNLESDAGALSMLYHQKSGALFYAGIGSTSSERACYKAWGNSDYSNESGLSVTPWLFSGPIPVPEKMRAAGLLVHHNGSVGTKTDQRFALLSQYGKDLSAYTTPNASESGISRDHAGVGITGELVQWRMINGGPGTPDLSSLPYQLLDMKVIIQQGGVIGGT